MINGKVIAIDARMIEMSGIGSYIQHLMGRNIYDIALGNEKIIRKYDKKVKVIPFDAKIYSIKEQLAFPYYTLKKENVALIHFPHYNVPLLYQGKYIATIHDIIHIKYPEYLKNNAARLYSKVLMRHAVKSATHIFTVSKNSKKDIKKYYSISENKITITYNAVDEKFTKLNETDYDYLYNKYSIPKNKSILLYVGNLKPHKNINIVFQALSLMEYNMRPLLILTGKSFDGVSIEEFEKKYGLSDNVITTGAVDEKDIIGLYNLADIFVFPSLYEGFGIPPLEAMACGTPVISSNSSSLPEVVGDAALLFDPNDAIKLRNHISGLLTNKVLYQEMIEKGYGQLKKFNWKSTIDTVKKEMSLLCR